MTFVTVDATTESKLCGGEPLLVYGPDGNLLGYFNPKIPPGVIKSPISDEELAELRKQTGGSPLSDVLKRIGAA